MNMHPTDHTSIAAVYSEQLRSNSGARYQRVTTYSVMKSVSEVVRASPKSQIFKSQFAFRSKLLGFRSRCKTFAECMYFSPRNNWYKKYCRDNIELSNYMLQETQAVNRFPVWKQVEFNSTFISSLTHHYHLEYNIFSSDVQESLPPCRNPNLKLTLQTQI
jgi:hypothetical protein